MKNRLKKREDTLCDYTVCGESIKEGDILGYGDNYPCVVLYNKFEARFEAIEFGYIEPRFDALEFKHTEKSFRQHPIQAYTVKWELLGTIDSNPELLKDCPEDFDYTDYISGFYN